MSLQRGSNGTQQIIDIPADTGGFLSILATGPVRLIEIVESTLTAEGAANAIQGFNYLIPNDGSANGFTTLFQNPPGTVLKFAHTQAQYTKHGPPMGTGPDARGAGVPARPATTLLKVQSMTGTGTS